LKTVSREVFTVCFRS